MYGTYHKHLSQILGDCPLCGCQRIFLQCWIGCDELKDLFLEHHMRLEGSEVGIPSCWNSVCECWLLSFV